MIILFNLLLKILNRHLQFLVFEGDFEYTPRDSFFYDIDGFRTAWANCRPPKSQPPVIPIWINGSSNLNVNESDSRIKVSVLANSGFFSQLVINPATKWDSGKWGCRAMNHTTNLTFWFNITLYGPPIAPQNMHVKQYRTNGFILKWDYLRNDLAFYDIKIKRLSSGVTTDIVFKEHNFPLWFQYTEYEFKGLVPNEDYEIVMRATDVMNQTGVWSSPFKTKTVSQFAPFFVNDIPQVIYVGEGKDVTLSCDVESQPPATFLWFRNDVMINSSSFSYTLLNQSLTILNVSRSDSGVKYKCTASNIVGNTTGIEATLNVQWIEKEFVQPPQNNFFYLETNFVRISFIIPNGERTPDISVLINNKLIDSTSFPHYSITLYKGPSGVIYNALDILRPDKTSEGEYCVIASNLAGNVTASFFLIIAGAPSPITYFKVLNQVLDTVILEWNLSLSDQKMANMGENFHYRGDILSFEIEYGESLSSVQRKKMTGDFNDTVYYKKTGAISGLIPGTMYKFRIRCTDYGNQTSEWSDTLNYTMSVSSSENQTASVSVSNVNQTVLVTLSKKQIFTETISSKNPMFPATVNAKNQTILATASFKNISILAISSSENQTISAVIPSEILVVLTISKIENRTILTTESIQTKTILASISTEKQTDLAIFSKENQTILATASIENKTGLASISTEKQTDQAILSKENQTILATASIESKTVLTTSINESQTIILNKENQIILATESNENKTLLASSAAKFDFIMQKSFGPEKEMNAALSTGVIAGIVVAVCIVIFLVVAAILIYKRRNKLLHH